MSMRRRAQALVLGAVMALTGITPGAAEPASQDPLADQQWGLQVVGATQAWEITRGDGAVVALLDSGVDLDHPDLAPNLLPGVTFSGCPSAADGCGDGGWQEPNGAGDRHGTALAGIVAAVEGNGIGVAGVAPDAALLPVRVSGGARLAGPDELGRGLRWAASHGADVILVGAATVLTGMQPLNGAGFDLGLAEAAAEAAAGGALLVAPVDADDSGLCDIPEVAEVMLCVTPVDPRGAPRATRPLVTAAAARAVAAPGGPMSSLPTAFDVMGSTPCEEGALSTSPLEPPLTIGPRPCGAEGYEVTPLHAAAAAHAAGAAALLSSMGCNRAEVLHLLTATARQPGTGARGVVTPGYGSGIIDAAAASSAAADLCTDDAPTPPEPVGCLQAWREAFDVEGVPDGWAVDTVSNAAATAVWEVVESGLTERVVETDASGLEAKDDRLVAPPFTPSPDTVVTFHHRVDLEHGRDGAVLEVSTDGGDTWADVGVGRIERGVYRGTIADGALAGRPAWTGRSTDADMTRVEVHLGDLAGQQVQLRWRLVQDARRADSLPGGGWAVDRVQVVEVGDDRCAGRRGDPLRDVLWGLDQVRASQAWATTRGEGAVVAIVDSGLDLDHPDLADGIAPGTTTAGCGAAGCGDGGYEGDRFHGTHVAGIVGAREGNAVGSAGVAPDATLLPVNVFGASDTASGADVAAGIRWAVTHGADVINLSLGQQMGTQHLDPLVPSATTLEAEAAVRRGVLVVAAAGNEPYPVCGAPGIGDGLLCVAATDRRGAKAAYSDFGHKEDGRTVFAPGGSLLELAQCGEGVVSTMPVGLGDARCGRPSDGGYDEYSGTSMAAPHVAGVGALVVSLGCTAQQAVEAITSTAYHPVTGARGEWSADYGYGIVDAGAAVAAAEGTCEPTRPSPPPPPAECPTTIAHEHFADGFPEGWSVDTAINESGTPTWHWYDDSPAPGSVPGIYGWQIRSAAHGVGLKDDRLVAPPFRATAETRVWFRHRFVLEQGHDGGVMDISTDGGQTWQPLPPDALGYGGYNGTLAAGNPAGPREAFTGTHTEVLLDSAMDLSQWAGEVVQLRWRLVQDGLAPGSTTGEVWQLSDVRFDAVEPVECPGT